jgi:hypothetical protein
VATRVASTATSSARGSRRNLVRFVERGQFARNAFEQRSLLGRPAFQPVGFLLRFDDFPVLDDLLCGSCGFVPENVRMPAHQLVAYLVDDGVDIEAAGFLCEVSMKDDVEENISQLFGKAFEIARLDGFEHFVDFLDQHGLERIEVLLLVPRTAVRTSQRGHDFDEPVELLLSHEPIIAFGRRRQSMTGMLNS